MDEDRHLKDDIVTLVGQNLDALLDRAEFVELMKTQGD